MAYVIKNSRGETVATLQTGVENTSATSITLLGAGFPNYGLQQNENFVYVLENFANSTAPSNPITGQLWYNTATDIISQRTTANTWQSLATQDYVQAQKISPVFTGVPQVPTVSTSTSSNIVASTAFVQNLLVEQNYAPIFSPNFTGIPTAPTSPTVDNSTRIATTEYVVSRINDPNLTPYAFKDSPALTGIPTAPTAANTTANTQIATTGFVSNLFNSIDLAPYATKASPALTGIPTAPTAANTTANTQIATTEFVANYVNDPNLSIYATKASPILTGIPQAPTASAVTNTNQIATTNFVQLQKDSPALTGSPTAPTPSYSDNSTKIATTQFVQTAINNIPISAASELAGSIKLWASAVPPTNWALCDGQTLSRTIYATLFSRIGTTYGAGDGSTTFNLPNFKDRFPVGAGGVYAAGATGGYADAAVITHTHPVSSSVSISDPGHNHTVTAAGVRHGYSGRNPGNNFYASDGDSAVGLIYPSMTSTVSTTGISASVNTSISAPTGSVPGTGRNLPPFLGAYWIIKLSDDGSGGGTLQAGAGIDIATGSGYSTITNTGVKTLTAGTGIGITGTAGNLTITNTGSLPTITAGQGINIVQNGSTFTITNTVTAPPVIGGNGISVTNTAGGAIVNAAVVGIVGGSGVAVANNNGTYTINSIAPAGSLSAWCVIGFDSSNFPVILQSYNMRDSITKTVVTIPNSSPSWNLTIPFIQPMNTSIYAVSLSVQPDVGTTTYYSPTNAYNYWAYVWQKATNNITIQIPYQVYRPIYQQSFSYTQICVMIAGGI